MPKNGDTSLALMSRAATMLAEATTIQKAKELKDLALTAKDWAERKKLGNEVISNANFYALMAEWKLGKLLKATERRSPKHGKGGGSKGTHRVPLLDAPPTLADLGISKNESAKAQQLSELSKDELETLLLSGKKTRKAVMKEMKKRKQKTERKRAARSFAESHAETIIHGDFRKVGKSIADNSVGLIFADPPYDRKAMPLYGDMAELGARILRPGGSLVCYAGQYLLPDILPMVSEHLRFWWVIACQHTGQCARMNEYGIVVRWKPLLWFVKKTREDKETFIDDLIISAGREKTDHDWQQSESEAEEIINKLTQPNDLVFDPFCGSGTTAVVAKRLKRRCLTCDVDETTVLTARKRYDESIQ